LPFKLKVAQAKGKRGLIKKFMVSKNLIAVVFFGGKKNEKENSIC
jgi:hypothetical protein